MPHSFVTDQASAAEICARIEGKIAKREAGYFSACWLWTGKISSHGYGRLKVPRTRKDGSAHRASYEAHIGPIPDGLDLDHLCRNRSCVNPAHLEPVTRRENIRRGDAFLLASVFGAMRRRVTHCPRGHAYDAANTRISRQGARFCRACGRLHTRKWREKLEAA